MGQEEEDQQILAILAQAQDGGRLNPSGKWHRALHGAQRPEESLVVRGGEVGLTGTSATATSSGAKVWCRSAGCSK